MNLDPNMLKGVFNKVLYDPNFQKMIAEIQESVIKTDKKEASPVKPFQTYRHNVKGTLYVVKEVVNTKTTSPAEFPVSVVYFDKQLETTWCRPLKEFLQKFTLIS